LAPSSSVAEGTLPPDRRDDFLEARQRRRAPRFTVAVGLGQLRLRGSQRRRANCSHLVVQLGGVQLDHHLARLDDGR
jgi:hypothetical protein